MLTTAEPHTAAEIDFGFDVDTIAALIGQLSEPDRTALYQRLGVRPSPKPRASKTAATAPYTPNTGDPRLDAFLTEHHDPNWKAWKPLRPRKASPAGARHLISAEAFEAAAAERWRARGYTVSRTSGNYEVTGDGDGSYARQMTAAYVATPQGWKHPDDVEANE
ncbi:hypothetical protein [Curtobacterium sp. 20TX0008]|uniref:hypothetical protein n=1 Tax=Curtobacterium sp. 20TX0008 TaxID=3022018 RepID=UPI00232A7EB0|nr:hypothetical protein [Curtobacterium sp. 20TX0008]MDB6425851.1 hypothetical protein [Curtobacterium sp. 20TX0008]